MEKCPPKYINKLSVKNKMARFAWLLVSPVLFRPLRLPIFHRWRNFVLRSFGARIGQGSIIHATAKIWAPWNLEVGMRTCVGPDTIIYNPAKITLGNKVSVSQYAHLCTASHNICSEENELITREIVVNDYAWIAADAFVGMGVTIGEGAVVGARAAVFKDVEPWMVVGGNPAKVIKKRELK